MRTSQSRFTFPSIDTVTRALQYVRDHEVRAYEDGEDAIDVRLQVTDSGWALRSGDSSYDLDHRGFWGVGAVYRGDTVKDLRGIAKDLLRQAREHFYGQF